MQKILVISILFIIGFVFYKDYKNIEVQAQSQKK